MTFSLSKIILPQKITRQGCSLFLKVKKRKWAEYGFGEYGFKRRAQWVFLALTEFRGESSVSSSQSIICVPKRTHRVFRRTHRVCRETQWASLSSLLRNSTLETAFRTRFLKNGLARLFTIENAPTCYKAPRRPDPEFPRKMPKKDPPARNAGLPEFTPKMPRKYRKNTPNWNTKNAHFRYFFGSLGVLSWGSRNSYFFGIFCGNSGSDHLGALQQVGAFKVICYLFVLNYVFFVPPFFLSKISRVLIG